MFQLMCFIKRKQGMSLEDLKRYFENHHRIIGEKHSKYARYCVRRYLIPLEYTFSAANAEPPYDVVTEMWFDNRDFYERSMAGLPQPEVFEEIVADEEKLFDRSQTRLVALEEHVSDPSALS